jgi:hypothetical protein
VDIIPDCFCWTRFGTESGEAVGQIFERKEVERIANGGVFIWGIGNSVGPSIRELVHRMSKPEVLFSPIKSSPRPQDVLPPAVAVWSHGETLSGEFYRLPEHSLVTSRYDPLAPTWHYALVCSSPIPISPVQPAGRVALAALTNLRTGRPIGASQVTAVVNFRPLASERGHVYDVSARAELAYPYFIKLHQPVMLQK